MVAHHVSLKLRSDRDLPIWLLRKRHELRETPWEDVGDLVPDQATDVLRDPEDCDRSDNLDIKDLFAEMTQEEGLEQRTQTQEAVLSNGIRTWIIMWYKYISLNLN